MLARTLYRMISDTFCASAAASPAFCQFRRCTLLLQQVSLQFPSASAGFSGFAVSAVSAGFAAVMLASPGSAASAGFAVSAASVGFADAAFPDLIRLEDFFRTAL